MTDSKKPGDTEKDLWEAAMNDVKPLKGRRTRAESPSKKPRATVRETVIAPPRKGKAEIQGGKGLDKRTDERLRKGKMEIDGRIDLHGLRQQEARDALTRMLLQSFADGKRCILVITGQGKEKANENELDWWESKPGLLRRSVPEWLTQKPLADIVLQTHTAKQHDGGAGALYVLLRRKRNR
jgi:DNA-nicking Smr family endonuclease